MCEFIIFEVKEVLEEKIGLVWCIDSFFKFCIWIKIVGMDGKGLWYDMIVRLKLIICWNFYKWNRNFEVYEGLFEERWFLVLVMVMMKLNGFWFFFLNRGKVKLNFIRLVNKDLFWFLKEYFVRCEFVCMYMN